MEPSNDHERAIASIIDWIAREGRLKLISIHEVVNAVDFMMMAEDNEFLMRYVQWLMANPIAK